jgi:ribosomal protein L37AE/L43A
MECPECGNKDQMRKNGSDVWSCDNCGWDEQEEIDHMNADMEDDNWYDEDETEE